MVTVAALDMLVEAPMKGRHGLGIFKRRPATIGLQVRPVHGGRADRRRPRPRARRTCRTSGDHRSSRLAYRNHPAEERNPSRSSASGARRAGSPQARRRAAVRETKPAGGRALAVRNQATARCEPRPGQHIEQRAAGRIRIQARARAHVRARIERARYQPHRQRTIHSKRDCPRRPPRVKDPARPQNSTRRSISRPAPRGRSRPRLHSIRWARSSPRFWLSPTTANPRESDLREGCASWFARETCSCATSPSLPWTTASRSAST